MKKLASLSLICFFIAVTGAVIQAQPVSRPQEVSTIINTTPDGVRVTCPVTGEQRIVVVDIESGDAPVHILPGSLVTSVDGSQGTIVGPRTSNPRQGSSLNNVRSGRTWQAPEPQQDDEPKGLVSIIIDRLKDNINNQPEEPKFSPSIAGVSDSGRNPDIPERRFPEQIIKDREDARRRAEENERAFREGQRLKAEREQQAEIERWQAEEQHQNRPGSHGVHMGNQTAK